MSARFRITHTFALPGRKLYVLTGEILEGVVAPGMVVNMPFNDAVAMQVRISGVEDVRTSDPGASIGLTLPYEDDDGLTLLEGMNFRGGDCVEITAINPAVATMEAKFAATRPWWRFW